MHGVTIIGHSRLPSTLPGDASKMYGKNILNFLQLMISKDGSFNLNMNDELVKGTCVAHGGELLK